MSQVVIVPRASKNQFEEDVLLLIKGRYHAPRTLHEALCRLIHVHYGQTVEFYLQRSDQVLAILLTGIEQIAHSVLAKPNAVALLCRRITEMGDKDHRVSLSDIAVSLMQSVRWGALSEKERGRLAQLTIDPDVDAYLLGPEEMNQTLALL